METKTLEQHEVDEGLVTMFLKISPDEHLQANDNSVRAILEFRNAYNKQKTDGSRSKHTA